VKKGQEIKEKRRDKRQRNLENFRFGKEEINKLYAEIGT
jgi:hypothetical protein